MNMTSVEKWTNSINPSISSKGMMFDLEAINDVTIYGIDLATYFPNSVGEIEIYVTKIINGTFVGKEADASKWTRVHNSSVTWKYNVFGAKIRLQVPFRIKANSKRGVYVTFTDSSTHRLITQYQTGTSVGNVVAETSDLRLLEGTRNEYPFGSGPTGPNIFFGRVRYFQSMACNSASECDDMNDGTDDSCYQGQCQNIPIPGVCGNGICEVSIYNEYCSTCASDCDDVPGLCNELHGIVDSSSMSTGGGVQGIVFAVEALKDITFYEIHAQIATWTTNANVKLYTKMGSFSGDSDLSRWQLVFSGNVDRFCTSSGYCSAAVMKFPLTSNPPVRTPAGSLRTFYLDLSTSPPLFSGSSEGEIVHDNDDLRVYSGTTVGADLGTIKSNGMTFSGVFKYDLGLVPWACSTSADCDDNKDGTEDDCVEGQCQNIPIPGVCGNGICEAWHNEYCSTCPSDCRPPLYCDELQLDQDNGYASYASNVRGIAFDVEAVQSLAVYEISLRMPWSTTSCGAKVYTKEGSYKDNESLNGRTLIDQSLVGWTLVCNEDNVQVNGSMLTLNLNNASPIVAEAGNKLSFYVTLSKGSVLNLYGDQIEGSVVKENSDVKVYAGEAYNTDANSPSNNDFKQLRGIIKYDLIEVEAPSLSPTNSVPKSSGGGGE